MKIGFNIKYLCAFIAVFVVEAIIAVFIHDNFIRPYIGDALVVVLIYCFIKTFVRNEVRLLPLYIFIFAALVELGQYFNLAELLGLSDYKIARIIIGSTFDIRDIACYLAGCVGLSLFERVRRRAGEEISIVPYEGWDDTIPDIVLNFEDGTRGSLRSICYISGT